MHDELGLVVDRLEEGTSFELGRHADAVDGVVQPAAAVHDVERLVDQRLEQVGRVGEGLAHPVGPDDGEAVAGEEELGVEREHPAQRVPPTRGGSAAPSAGCRRWATPR